MRPVFSNIYFLRTKFSFFYLPYKFVLGGFETPKEFENF